MIRCCSSVLVDLATVFAIQVQAMGVAFPDEVTGLVPPS